MIDNSSIAKLTFVIGGIVAEQKLPVDLAVDEQRNFVHQDNLIIKHLFVLI